MMAVILIAGGLALVIATFVFCLAWIAHVPIPAIDMDGSGSATDSKRTVPNETILSHSSGNADLLEPVGTDL